MDEKDFAGSSEEWVSDDATSIAESVQKDFSGLIAILDRQLETVFASDSEARSAISQARAAAARGLQLSGHLISLLQDSRRSA